MTSLSLLAGRTVLPAQQAPATCVREVSLVGLAVGAGSLDHLDMEVGPNVFAVGAI